LSFNPQIILPEIIIVLTGLIVLIADLFFFRERNKILAFFSALGVFIAFIVTISLRDVSGKTLSGLFVLDIYSIYFKIIFLIIAMFSIVLSVSFFKEEDENKGEFYSLLMFAILGMMLIVSTKDFIMIYITLELISISSYIMAGYRRKDPKSNEAVLKYFLLGLLASALMLYGISFVYGFTGTTNLNEIAVATAEGSGKLAIIMGVIFALSGFCFKIAAVPFHQWVPDTYEGAPTPVTAFMSVGPKTAAIGVLIRILLVAFPSFLSYWRILFIILSILSMFTGNLLALSQTNIKRMLAYSTIAHAGYMIMGLAINSKFAITGILLYAFIYTFMNMGAFSVIIAISHNESAEEIENYTGLSKRAPFLAATMAVFMLALAGLPPLAGLWGKWFIFAAAIKGNLLWLALIGLLNSVISLYYYANIVRHMYLMEPVKTEEIEVLPLLRGAIIVAVVFVIVVGFYPDPLMNFSGIATYFVK
jgi:NADH-quinone oxidoreductase subunit N